MKNYNKLQKIHRWSNNGTLILTIWLIRLRTKKSKLVQDLTGMTIKGIMYIYFCEFLVTRQNKPPIILFMEWSHWNYNAWGSYGSYTIGKANKCCPGNIKKCIRIYLNLINMLTLMCIAGDSTLFPVAHMQKYCRKVCTRLQMNISCHCPSEEHQKWFRL